MFDFQKMRRIALVSLFGAFPPLTTDMYLPALPDMAVHFDVPLSVINLTLMVFFVFFSISVLIWGPLSDKYGRKPILVWGSSLFLTASIGCVFSTNVYMLIFFRALQAAGGGAAVSMSMAILKDVYGPKEREKAIAAVSVIMATAPIVSPVIGAAIMTLTSWRGIFIVLAGIGVVSLVSSMFMKETMLSGSNRSILGSLARLSIVYSNKSFSRLLFLFSLPMLAVMGFIGTSSNIFINGFGVSEQFYSFCFALNAVFFTVGPILYIALSRYFSPKDIITASYGIMIVVGFGLIVFGGKGPLIFTGILIPLSIAITTAKPPSTNLMLEQVDQDAGTASSLMGCAFAIFSSIGVIIASLGWSDRIVALGSIFIGVGLISLISWLMIQNRYFLKTAAKVGQGIA
jgi:DHA1 family bicyclomycin/chloramphenicol resistance-like MFS transporter